MFNNAPESSQEMKNLFEQRDEVVIAVSLVSLPEGFKLWIFEDEKKLDNMMCEEGPFKLEGSGICCCFNLPLSSALVDVPFDVSRAVARFLSQLAKDMRNHRGEPVFGKETKALRALELEVENPELKVDAFTAPGTVERMVLTVALLRDGKVQTYRSGDPARTLKNVFYSGVSAFGCCEDPQGECFPCEFSALPRTFARVFASLLSGITQQRVCWDLKPRG